MAIDPATAKAIVQAAAKVVTDPETRSKVLYIIFGGLIGLVVVILIPIYLLTHPLEMLRAMLADSPDASGVEQFIAENEERVFVFDNNIIWNEGADYPMPLNGSITSEHGNRPDPFNSSRTEFHNGIDIVGAWHANVIAVAAGVVERVNTAASDYGNNILIKHTKEDGAVFYSFYAHLSQIYMFEGQTVMQGAVIGLEGGDPENDPNPGRTTGHHLHFEIRTPGQNDAVDPKIYLFEQEETESSEESEAQSSP